MNQSSFNYYTVVFEHIFLSFEEVTLTRSSMFNKLTIEMTASVWQEKTNQLVIAESVSKLIDSTHGTENSMPNKVSLVKVINIRSIPFISSWNLSIVLYGIHLVHHHHRPMIMNYDMLKSTKRNSSARFQYNRWWRAKYLFHSIFYEIVHRFIPERLIEFAQR